MTKDISTLDLRIIANQIRLLTIDAIEKAGCGHPGLPLGMADIATVLWSHYLRFSPQHPQWPDRDRFILSAGHGSMLLYSLLHLYGYDVSLEDIKSFRQWQSKTPGHPEFGSLPGVEITTGPLGQGLASAVGFSLAEKILAEKEGGLTNHYTYVIASDGDLMEGISQEACSLAGHWQLRKLIVFYDDNRITIDGSTKLSYCEDTEARFTALGWQVFSLKDGHDFVLIKKAIENAHASKHKPVLIICRTKIGYGSPNREGTARAHGEALGPQEAALTKANLLAKAGQTDLSAHAEPFSYIFDVVAFREQAQKKGEKLWQDWQQTLQVAKKKWPEKMRAWEQRLAGDLPEDWQSILATSAGKHPAKEMASRQMSGQVLSKLVGKIPGLIGGAADLTPSVNTFQTGMEVWPSNASQNSQPPPDKTHASTKSQLAEDEAGREISHYIHYGVREHGMAAIMNGLALHGGFIPYGGTFLIFSDYMRPSIRLAALMGVRTIYIFTHDSIALGEDGPTHQPVEHLTALRAIPNLQVLRPSSFAECSLAWKLALQNKKGPTCIILSRQKIPLYTMEPEQLGSSATTAMAKIDEETVSLVYQKKPTQDVRFVLLATGAEVSLAIEVCKFLEKERQPIYGRVLSLLDYSKWKNMPRKPQASLLLQQQGALVASIEAGNPWLWLAWVSHPELAFGIDEAFGASAPYPLIYQKYGFAAEHVAKNIQKFRELNASAAGAVPMDGKS